jgi:nucleoside 2-deoxyribosyltransferase
MTAIAIAGGIYREFCDEPFWAQVYGSGGRAAAALSGMSRGVSLHAYASESVREAAEVLAATYNFKISLKRVGTSPEFAYSHALATPSIRPERSSLVAATPLQVSGSAVLRFGFLEGDARVDGDRVVYDPQSPVQPHRFDANGSVAKKLAMVVNRAEGRALTREREPSEIIRALRRLHHADVAVLKMGADGLMVGDAAGIRRLPAFQTSSVFPIGSGDVFSAMFAYYWAAERRAPQYAATRASLAAAHYCQTASLPIDMPAAIYAKYPAAPLLRKKRKPLVYLAGPFFDMAQRWLIFEARSTLLAAGFRVFSPLHDVGRGAASDVAPADLLGLRRADAVYAIVDGLDSGTLFEIGYAVARGTPVVAFSQRETTEPLKMLHGSDFVVESDFATSVYKLVWLTMKQR